MDDLTKMNIESTDKSVDKYLIDREDPAIVIDHLELFVKELVHNPFLDTHRVLDLGCGHGRDCWYLEEHGFRPVGIDLSEKMLEVARKRCSRSMFLNMDMRDIDRIPWMFDGVWSSASFYHIQKKEAYGLILKMQRVLKPDGILYIGVKQGEGEKILGRSEIGVSKFYSLYNEREIVELVSKAGFEVFEVAVRGWLDKKRTEDIWINVFARNKFKVG